MSQTERRDLERGGGPVHGHSNQRQSTSNQPLQSSEPDYSDGAMPLYSIYSNIAEDEDSKMVERCQNDSDGTLIFTGLFSATVGALITVSVQDLKPNSQDAVAFYLKNIYQHFGNPNVSYPSIPFTLAEPPAFSPPRYAIWVNSLWFLSLIVSVSGALVATLFRNWAVQYISVTQSPWYTPDKRARVRAIFAEGEPGPYVLWGVGHEPFYLHLSLFLFVVGSLIYLFNINRAVFYAVVWWVGYMTITYAATTVSVFFEPRELLHTPFSLLALQIYLGIAYVVWQVCSCILPLHGLGDNARRHYRDLSRRYSKGILIGKRREAEKFASKRSREIDDLILERILPALDNDHALETFFDAIPGFCRSKLSALPLSDCFQDELRQTLDYFLNRTFSSSLVSESVRAGRFITCLNAANAAFGPDAVSRILDNLFNEHWNGALQFVEIGHALRRWAHGWDHDLKIRRIVARMITRTRRRDVHWSMLVKETFGVPDGVLQDSLAHGDSALLSILIYISRQANRARPWTSGILSSLSGFDIHNTLPKLQRDFCTLWNEIAQEARSQGSSSTSAQILRESHHLYIALHQGTDSAPTASSAPTPSVDPIPEQPLSYPLCDIADHRPDSTIHIPVPSSRSASLLAQPSDSPDGPTHQFTLDCSTLHLAEETNIYTGLPSPPPDTSTFRDSKATFPVRSSSPPSERPLQCGVAAEHRDITSFPASSGSFSTPDSPLPPTIPPLPSVEPLALLSGRSPKGPADGATLPRLHTRRLVDGGNKCLANAVLQLLVYCPPFRDLFGDLGRLIGQREGGEVGGGATPLIYATVRFLDEFVYKEKSSLTMPDLEKAIKGTAKEDVDPLMPTYVYCAMRGKRKFANMKDGQQQDAKDIFALYLEALDEEFVALHASMSLHKESAESGEGQLEVGERDCPASSVKSSITRIFGGRSRSTVRAPNQPDIVAVEDWRLLQLDIQPESIHTVEDALAYISRPQPVQISQSGSSEASQQVLLEALPLVLVLRLERFLYNAAADDIVKIGKPIQFAPELEIPLEIMSGKSVDPAHYKLYGVLYHHGKSATGKYTVDVLRSNEESGDGETWLHIDDEAVSAVQHEDVFGGHEKERVGDQCAYMLFYCRTSSA